MDIFTEPYITALLNVLLFLLVTFIAFFYRYIYPKKSINFLFIILVISILPVLSIFRDGVFSSGDMRTHLAHLINFYTNLEDGNILPKWAGDLCGMKGCPIFQITYILPYYFGSIFHFVGFDFLTSIKLVYASSFILSGFTMYLWARENFGKLGGLIASVFYLFAPYHLIDLHFRGSVGEVLSFVFIPLVFLFTKKIIETGRSRYFFLESLSIVLLLMSHSSIAIVTVPVALLYGYFICLKNKNTNRGRLIILTGSYLYAILITMFYWLPAYQEVKYTWQSKATYGYFMSFIDYIVSPARFGMLYQDSTAQIRPIIGYMHAIVFAYAVFLVIKGSIKKEYKNLLLFFIITSIFLFFMMLQISEVIWRNISILHSFIMVHRLLVLNSFILSTISALILIHLRKRKILLLILYLTIFLSIFNWANRYMIPAPTNPIRNENEFFSQFYDVNNQIYEVRRSMLVKNREKLAYDIPSTPIEILQGNGSFLEIKRRQNSHEYLVSAKSEIDIRENTHYFPGWKVYANSNEVSINYENNQDESFGFITFSLPEGLYKIEVTYTDTPIRIFSLVISVLVFSIGFFFFAFYSNITSFFKKIISK